MRKPLKIGKKEYKFKKDAIAHYRTILNSYDFGESLKEADFDDIIDLLDFEYLNNLAEDETSDEIFDEEITNKVENDEDQVENYIEDIKIAKVQFNTKCFEIFFSDKTSYYISYFSAGALNN